MTPRHTLELTLLLAASACAAPPAPEAPAPSVSAPAIAGTTEQSPPAEPLSPSEQPRPPDVPTATDSGTGSTRHQLLGLPVPGFLDAVIALPGGSARLPLVVSTHGAGGDPEWTCDEWGARVRGRFVVLCPRGKAISKVEPSGFYYPEHNTLEKEVLAAVAALESKLADRILPGPALYAGYSQGATMGALFLVNHAARFPALVLTEGGFASWTRANASAFKRGGGKRVLFVCGGQGCRNSAEKSRAMLASVGVEARVEYVPGGGHTDGGSVGQRLDTTFEWARGE